jgi:Ser/Thr protein kinase RdoA (MazF antagonist)
MLFDFDFCGLGWQVTDVATYRWQARVEGAEQQAWDGFRQGYLEMQNSSTNSLQFVELFMMLKHLWNKAHMIRFYIRHGRMLHINDKFLEDAVSFCEKLAEEYPATLN